MRNVITNKRQLTRDTVSKVVEIALLINVFLNRLVLNCYSSTRFQHNLYHSYYEYFKVLQQYLKNNSKYVSSLIGLLLYNNAMRYFLHYTNCGENSIMIGSMEMRKN